MTTQSVSAGRAMSWPRLSLRRRTWLVVLALLAAVAVGGTSYAIGSHHHGAQTHVATGYAYASPLQISAFSGGWSYDIPLDVRWLGTVGGWHEGSRPACLPASTGQLQSSSAGFRSKRQGPETLAGAPSCGSTAAKGPPKLLRRRDRVVALEVPLSNF
jgi:hypothetical protein